MILVKEIIAFLGKDVINVFGNIENVYVKHLGPTETVDEFTLDWINTSKAEKQFIAENSKAKVILVDDKTQFTKAIQEKNKILIVVINPNLSILKIGNHYFKERIKPGIHSSANIHPLAKLGKNIFIGSNASIGASNIGNNVIIYPNVVINDNVTICNNVIIKPGAILGFDGFGYYRDEFNNLVQFPQLGQLVINDNVEIGANTCIDKGSLSDTIIGFNTKINNLCHIAHNVVIGKNVVITAQVNISGSTIIEDDVWISPNSSLRGHQKIGKGAKIGMGAVVTKDVPSGEIWIGNPAKKMKK
jgi:UDP-3-O-[3-hydroxymyristoyl] glucosamine N-acyltransferase